MGGRGTFASGINNPYNKYEEIGKISGVKVLKGIQGHHKLPEESRTSRMYIRVLEDNTFRELRVYRNNKVAFEIAYHGEINLTGDRNKNVFHYHIYTQKGGRSDAIKLSKKQYEKYKKFFGGLKYD